MDEKRRDGYVTGVFCLVISSLFLIFIINSGWNSSTQIMLVFTILFGGLGIGSLLKPDSIGAVASQLLKNFAKSGEEESDSHNKQIQKKSPGGVIVTATHGAKVNINVPSGKKRQTENPPEEEEEKEILRKETIVISPSESYSYEFELTKGDHLKGEILSTSRIDVYFVDDFNFGKWNKDKSFDCEYSNEGVLETNIDYLVPEGKKGTWYLIIENNGRKSATVKVLLY